MFSGPKSVLVSCSQGRDVHRKSQISYGKSQKFRWHDGKIKTAGKKWQRSCKTVIACHNSWSTMYAADCTLPSKLVTSRREMTLGEEEEERFITGLAAQ